MSWKSFKSGNTVNTAVVRNRAMWGYQKKKKKSNSKRCFISKKIFKLIKKFRNFLIFQGNKFNCPWDV